MKVVLIKDVRDLGKAHETIDVADGYALNFLIPKKSAIPATPNALRAAETHKVKIATDKAVQEDLLAKNFETLAEIRISINVKANEKGHLYNAVGVPEILVAIKEQAHVELPEDSIRIEHPFKEIGEHKVSITHGANFGKFSIIIEAE